MALLSLLFGEGSQVAKYVQSWVKHMVNWEQVYDAQQEDDITFMTQVLFHVNAAVNKHLESCKSAQMMTQVNDCILCVSKAQD